VQALREGGDDGHPITVTDPDSEAATLFRAMAEKIAVDLRPKKVFNPQLKII
jgi:ATP-binding protein involved in chromosome partitioning